MIFFFQSCNGDDSGPSRSLALLGALGSPVTRAGPKPVACGGGGGGEDGREGAGAIPVSLAPGGNASAPPESLH